MLERYLPMFRQFRKIYEATVSFIISVRLFVLMEQPAPTRRIFTKFDIRLFFENFENFTKILREFGDTLYENLSTFIIISTFPLVPNSRRGIP